MSFRRTVSTVAAVAITAGGLALGGGAVATASPAGPAGKPAPDDHAHPPCGRTVVQSLTTTLSTGDTPAMTLDVTVSPDPGRLVAVVGNAEGVLEYGPLAPVSGGPAGSYTGVFVPPSGTPVADGDKVLVIACGDHWLTSATVGTAWTAGHGGKSGGPDRPTGKPDGPGAGSPEPTSSSSSSSSSSTTSSSSSSSSSSSTSG